MDTDTLWERIKRGIIDSAATAAHKAEHLGKIGRARLDIAGTRHAIHEAFAELGGAVYAHLSEGGEADVAQADDVQDLVRRINELENLLQEREAHLNNLKSGNNQEAEKTAQSET
ncbi:MAG: hypothetical protein OXR72_07400 [Gemmatimonadota bacterium]|nr:hypothetical protein [Gemmatimonadota bacterium]